MLASASTARRALLDAAGLAFSVRPAAIDEDTLKAEAHARGLSAEETALRLGEKKAGSAGDPGALVIAGDQILVCDGVWFDKPATLQAARAQLILLRGRSHTLVTSCVVMRDGSVLFRHLATPRLTMRQFSDAFLDTYLAREGEAVLGAVGAYRLEGLGIQLFAGVEGEYGAILGLPILALLGFLRGYGIIPD